MNENTNDITLSAYIDGELPDDAASELQARLANEPALAQRLATLRASDTKALRHFAAIDQRPMPEAVLEMLEKNASSRETSNVVAFPKRGIQQFFQTPVAIAASVALLAGFIVADVFRASQPAAPAGLYAGQVATDSALHNFLETASSAEPELLGDAQVAELILTFQNRDGEYCRQLRLDGANAPLQGLACRRGDTWQVETVSISGKRAPDGSYQTASGDTPPAINSAIDGMIGVLPPFDLDEETALISSGWKKSVE